MRTMENFNSLIKEKEKGVKCLKSPRLPRHKTRELAAEIQVVKPSKEQVDNWLIRDLAPEHKNCGVEGYDSGFPSNSIKQGHSITMDSNPTINK